MQLQDLRSTLVKLLDEDNVFRPDATLNKSLNDGYQFTAMLSQGAEITHSFNIGADELFKFLPTDFFVPISVWTPSARLHPIRSSDLDILEPGWISAASGVPAYYFTHGALTQSPSLWIYPRSTVGLRMRMTYAAIPNRMTEDTDIPRIPLEHHYAIVLFAYAWELLKERGFVFAGKALRVFSDYTEELNRLQRTVYKRVPDRDWLTIPWDIEAVRRKLHNFELAVAQQPKQQEQQDLR